MTMTDEIEGDILEAELEDDALEKRMRKLEADAARLLDHSTELIREMTKGREQREKQQEEEPVTGES
ncbi:MAG TPA: hypothetical protein PKJ10_03870 [Smithella sp.]|nr:hypothetical protein [Smithella sp.]